MSEKLPRVDCQQLVHVLEQVGFERKRQKGSHLHLWRERDKKRVTVPMHKVCTFSKLFNLLDAARHEPVLIS